MKSKNKRPVSFAKCLDLMQTLEGRVHLAAHILGSSASYATIQAAVDAATPGAVIDVDAGKYAEKIAIYKSLTIRGPQAGVDARGNVRTAQANEAVVAGATISSGVVSCTFYIAANDVTIDGFTVQGESYKNTATGAGIVIAPNIAGTHVLNDVVQNNYTGLFLSNNSATDAALIQHCLFRDNYNPNDSSDYSKSGNDNRQIYSDGSVSGGKLTNVTIDANSFLFDVVPPDAVEGAIGLECYTSGAQTNIRITNNTFDGVGKDVLYFDTVGLTITGNTATHTYDVASGVFRDEGNSQNVTIQNNNVYDSYGPFLRINNRAAPGNSSGYHVNNNNIINDGSSVHGGNSWYTQTKIKGGVILAPDSYTGTIDLTNNWWGSTSGPSGTGYNGSGTGIASETSGQTVSSVASPWLSSPAVAVESAYLGVPFSDGAPIQAEYFNHGSLGVAYSNANSTTPGGKFRGGETVGVIASTDTGAGFAVSSTKANDWLDYAAVIASGGTFRLDLRYNATGAAAIHLLVDGVNVTGTIALAATNTSSFFGGVTIKWATASKAGLALAAGAHLLRLVVDSGSPALNWFQLINTGTPPPTAATALATQVTAATANTGSKVILTWGNTSPTQTGAKVQRSADGGATWATLATVTASDYVDPSASPGVAYQYRIIATGAGGDAPASNTASATAGNLPTGIAVALSGLTPTTATSGYGTVKYDQSVAGNMLSVGGKTYASGIGTHAASTIVYAINGGYSSFSSVVGVDDEENGRGTGYVDFQVFGDGVLLFDSGVLTNGQAAQFTVNLKGVQQLKLVATNGIPDNIDYDHADWANATLLT